MVSQRNQQRAVPDLGPVGGLSTTLHRKRDLFPWGPALEEKAKIRVANKNEKQYNKTVQRVTAASAVRSAQGSLPWGHVRRGGETINWLLWRCQLLSFEERKPNSLPGSERLITASLVSKKMRPHESAPKACASFHVCICANQAPWRRTYAT